MRGIGVALGLFLLVGCIPRMVVVHDGLEGTVVDAATKEPLAGAVAYDGFDNGRPRILAQSDVSGNIRLEPKTRLEFVPLTGEALVFQTVMGLPRRLQPGFSWRACRLEC